MSAELSVASPTAGEASATALPDPDPRGAGHQVLAGRRVVSLNGAWRFATGEPGGTPGAATDPVFDDSGWDTLSVPGNWDLHDRYADHQGAGWYRREFRSPAVDADEVVRLHFEAVNYFADVWVNGAHLGRHTGGYTPFEFDVTDLLNPDGGNVVVVRAENTYEVGATWPWGGVSRSVTLTVDPAVRIDRQAAGSEPDLAAGTAEVSTRVAVSNAGESEQAVVVGGAVTDLAGQPLAGAIYPETEVVVPAGAHTTVSLATTLTDGTFRLWSIDDPQLYRSTVTLRPTGFGRADYAVSDRIGIRKVEVDPDGLYLNGERVRLNGYNRVPGDRLHGSVEPEHAVRAEIDRMKAAGANLLRLHHVPQAPNVLDYLDEKGILNIGEISVWGKDVLLDPERWTPELQETVCRDFNHPSIFAWSVANEIAGTSQAGRDFVAEMFARTRELDRSRLLTYVSNTFSDTSDPREEALRFTDFASVNLYEGSGQRLVDLREMYPGKPILITEYSHDTFTFTPEREDLDFVTVDDELVDVFAGLPYVIGSARWTFDDYRSGYQGTSTNQVRGWGIQNVWGGLKRAYAQMRAANAPVTRLEILGSREGDERVSVLRVVPAGPVDTTMPAYRLRDHRLVWQTIDARGHIIDGRILPLPDILPGDAPLTRVVTWGGAGAVTERLTLLDRLGYEVTAHDHAISAPAAPAVREIIAADHAVRAVFEHVAGADAYRVEAEAADLSAAATTYRNDFADVTGLPAEAATRVRVVAINDAGATPSDWLEVAAAAPPGPLPPRIQAVLAVENGAVLGWSGLPADDAYDIEVTEARDGRVIDSYRTALRGSSRVEGLRPGERHRIRMRSIRADVPGTWSEWREVTPRGSSGEPEHQEAAGVVTGADMLGVRIAPVPRAIRYHVQAITPDGDSSDRIVEASAVSLVPIRGLRPDTAYTLRLVTETADGMFAPVVVHARTMPEKGE